MPISDQGDQPNQGASYEKKNDGKITSIEAHFTPTHSDHDSGASVREHQAKQVHTTDLEPKIKGKKTAY